MGAPVYQRASLIASSTASAPVTPKTTRLGSSPGARPAGQALTGLVRQVEVVHEAPGLVGHGLDHGRVAVPDVGDREAGQHVDVLLAVGVPDAGAAAAHDRGRAVEQGEADLAGRLAAHVLAQ